MNIWIVCYPTFWWSGIVATELWIALAAKWHKVHFITYSQPIRLDIFTENIFYHEVNISDYPLFEYKPYESALTSKLVDVIKHEKLDLIHVHYAIPHATAAYMAQQIVKSEGIYIPFITTLHGTDITLVGRDESFEPVISFSINQTNAVTAVSQSLKDDTYKYFHIQKDIHVIPNFINFQDYEGEQCNDIRQKYATQGERILVHVSNFRKVKRVQDVIQIFATVNKEIPSKLLLVWDWPERNKMEKLSRELEIYDDIHFFGKIKKPEKLLKACDIFILPSETESFWLAALEAMAAWVPVISSNTGGLPEVNIHGVSWYTSNVWDIQDMATNTIKLLQDEKILAQFKKQAYQQAQKFSIDKVIPLYEDLYTKIISQ